MKTPLDKPTPEDHLTLWVREKVHDVMYGEITLTIHMHQGKITAAEKKITLKDKFPSK